MAAHRSTGTIQVARAIWYVGNGRVELKPVTIEPPQTGFVGLRMLYSGISRGTERLVFNGAVGESEYERMRAPFQEGSFSFPIKYGYCATAIVENGPHEIVGRTVFCLHPHQDYFVIPADAISLVPANIPARRATLAANMETALNAIWDSGSTIGDKVVIVGAGVVGLLIAYLLAKTPGTDITIVDVNTDRRAIAKRFGATFATPDEAPKGRDVVFHTSATDAGLATAMNTVGREGTVVELSWYGDKQTSLALGGAFHSQRLRLIASQVGHVSPHRRARWSHRDRLAKAIELLADPILDDLVNSDIAFQAAATELPKIFADDVKSLAPVIKYDAADDIA